MYLLDTNVISELRHGKPKQSAAVRAWAERQPGTQLYLSAITALEMEIGVLRIECRDPAQGAILRAWAKTILSNFQGRVLPFTSLTVPACARLHVPNPHSFRDSMIAATALEHGFAIVTRNAADFEGTGAQLLNPWETEQPPT